jgi:TRAP-type C4-dicarboxylate transport system permease small subunit
MSDRGFLFLFSVLMIALAAAAVAYLAATGQVTTMDGLFLTLTALLLAAGFAIYLIYLIRRAMETAKPAAQTPPAVAGAAAESAPVKG